MQQVQGFSRLQTAPSEPATAARPKLWILSSWRDLVLYVGTPLLLIPAFALPQAEWSPQDIYLFVAAFGAMGHHLPGMIRAYGDRALFERFRWRFILAPLFLLAVCVAFFWWDLKGILLVFFFWGVWHGLMTPYGFWRIYDAKTGTFDALTRRLDFAMCLIWFATAVVLSPYRLRDTLETYYMCGGPFIPPSVVQLGQNIVLAAAIFVTVLFAAHFIRTWVTGHRPNPVKLALLVTSIAFWWYCNNLVSNILVGIALFEVFHDVQYLSLVWIYNRNRVENDSNIGGFMRFVFRRSGSLIGLYVGLIFAYGAVGYYKSSVGVESVKTILAGVVTASALLHFYYDGFIWKVREKSTRQSLGISGGTADVSAKGFLPGWALHGAKWVGVFVIPLGALWIGQTHPARSELDRVAMIAADLPTSSRAHLNHATALQDAGQADEAAEAFSNSLRLNPDSAKAHVGLATILTGKGELDEAHKHYETALKMDPNNAEYHSGYAYLLEQLGHDDQAAAECEAAVRLAPTSALAHHSYGAFLEKHGKLDEATAQYREAVRADPSLADAQIDLGTALLAASDLQGAKEHLQAATKLDPKLAQPHNYLGKVFMGEGNVPSAIAEFEEALRLHPDFPEAEENLRMAKARGGDSLTLSPR